MEYIKKEELIEGEIYYVSTDDFWMIGLVTKSNNGDNSNGAFRGNATFISKELKFEKDQSWCYKANRRTYRLATSEEKHWLNECIKLDKFITFEEAMKTFIPEYVECIRSSVNGFTENKIYKIEKNWNDSINFQLIDDNSSNRTVIMIGSLWQFKPSTKEAYDAQFVVKEPEFVLPELWHIIITTENYEILSKYFSNNSPHSVLYTKGIMGFYKENKLGHTHTQIKGYDWDFGIEITFEQFKKYVLKEEIVEEKVIEPLPQFKVIETIETITKVENNEGNQFFIGDKVKTLTNNIYIITGFKYNENKTNILAIFDNKNSFIIVGIDKIEHYIEPKAEVKEETLLEKVKRLYPIGTKVKTVYFGRVTTIKTDIFHETNHDLGKVIYADNGNISIYSEKENHWATIIE